MKCAIYRQDLINALSRVGKVVPSVKVSPILTYVLVSVENEVMTLTATDLSNFISVSTTCKSAEDGVALFPSVDFLSALKTLNHDAVVISFEENSLKLRAGSSGWNWRTLDPKSFPSVPQWEQSKVFIVDIEKFVRAARRVKPAVAVESFSKNLEQIGFVSGRLQAADGARFHQYVVNDSETSMALPTSFVEDLIQILPLLGQQEFEIGMTEPNDAIVVKCSGVIISTKTKKDTFPDLNKSFLVPAMTNFMSVKVSKQELIDALRRVRITADKNSRLVVLRLETGRPTMTITAQQANGSSASDEVDVEATPQSRLISLNVDYLIQALAMVDEDVVELKLGADSKNKPSTVLIQQGDATAVLNQLRATI